MGDPVWELPFKWEMSQNRGTLNMGDPQTRGASIKIGGFSLLPLKPPKIRVPYHRKTEPHSNLKRVPMVPLDRLRRSGRKLSQVLPTEMGPGRERNEKSYKSREGGMWKDPRKSP